MRHFFSGRIRLENECDRHLYIELYIGFSRRCGAYIAPLYNKMSVEMKKEKKTVSLDMKELAKALREMISEESSNASKAVLSGARESVFRDIFMFYYPSFLQKLYRHVPEVDRSEELVCMLVALRQPVKEIAELMCLPVARVQLLYDSVLRKLDLEDEKEMKRLLKRLLS